MTFIHSKENGNPNFCVPYKRLLKKGNADDVRLLTLSKPNV
jgi:hypothetical protein